MKAFQEAWSYPQSWGEGFLLAWLVSRRAGVPEQGRTDQLVSLREDVGAKTTFPAKCPTRGPGAQAEARRSRVLTGGRGPAGQQDVASGIWDLGARDEGRVEAIQWQARRSPAYGWGSRLLWWEKIDKRGSGSKAEPL